MYPEIAKSPSLYFHLNRRALLQSRRSRTQDDCRQLHRVCKLTNHPGGYRVVDRASRNATIPNPVLILGRLSSNSLGGARGHGSHLESISAPAELVLTKLRVSAHIGFVMSVISSRVMDLVVAICSQIASMMLCNVSYMQCSCKRGPPEAVRQPCPAGNEL